ncbi:hypothetical protein GW17_00052608, partial [Ensete ventricosum]
PLHSFACRQLVGNSISGRPIVTSECGWVPKLFLGEICPLVKERSLRPLHSLSASVAGGPSINYEFRVRVEVVSYEVISDTFYAFSHTAYVYGLLGSE